MFSDIFIDNFNYLLHCKKKNRQEVQNQSYTYPADRKSLDRDKVNNFHLPSSLRGRCLKGKGKRVSGARETRNSRNKPKIPFSFPFKRLPRRVLPSNLLRALWFGFVYSLGEIASKVDRNKLPEVMKQIFKLLLTRQSHTRIRTFFFSIQENVKLISAVFQQFEARLSSILQKT